MFEPPRCPHRDCEAHRRPDTFPKGFCTPHGSYQPKCRPYPVPRFRCKGCDRTFSRQTFRADYHDKKPYLNAPLFRLLASGLGLRQSGRVLNLSRRCTELKARKISRHLGRLNRNLMDTLPGGAKLTLDEMETFECERAVLPVTVPVLVEKETMYVLATEVAPIRPGGRKSKARRKAIARAERRLGRRKDFSRNAIARVFRRLRWFHKEGQPFSLVTDKKRLYGSILRKYFGRSIPHRTVSSRRRRDQTNPLRFINVTNAMARDLNGRLRRQSWLVSKHRKFLRLQLHVFTAYRNFVRRKVNRMPETPAQLMGFLSRQAAYEDLLTWRQDWKWNSIHPLARRSESIAQLRGRPHAAA